MLTEVAEGSDQKSDWMGHCREDGEFTHKRFVNHSSTPGILITCTEHPSSNVCFSIYVVMRYRHVVMV